MIILDDKLDNYDNQGFDVFVFQSQEQNQEIYEGK